MLLNAFDNCDVRLDNAVDLLHNRLENVHDAEMMKSKSEFVLVTKTRRVKNSIKAGKEKSSYETNFVVFKMGHFFNFVIEFIPFSEGWYHHSHSHWINKTGDGLVLTHLGLNSFLLHAYIKDPGERVGIEESDARTW